MNHFAKIQFLITLHNATDKTGIYLEISKTVNCILLFLEIKSLSNHPHQIRTEISRKSTQIQCHNAR